MSYIPDPDTIEFYDDEPLEPACSICDSSLDYETCSTCGGEGYAGHDCGEDCCPCLNPEDNLICDVCDGNGGWWCCPNAKNHPKNGQPRKGVV